MRTGRKGQRPIWSMLSRRTLLIHGSLILGFPFLPAPVWAQETSRWLKKARSQMKKDRRPGVLISVPIEAGRKRTLAASLQTFLESPLSGELLAEAVFACVPEMKDRKAVEVESADGTSIASGSADFARPEKAAEILRLWLDGKDDARLKERAEAAREALEPDRREELDRALDNLGSEEYARRERATEVLVDFKHAATPILLLTERGTKDPEVRARCRSLVRRNRSPKLPFGTQLAAVDPCIGCGMAIIREPVRKALRFLK